jgi:acyl-CoA synthetase (AMP-forming)/AMP-acid ligase II
MSQSNVYYYPTVYACIAAGGTFFGAPTRWSPDEYAKYAVHLAGATHFLVEPAFLPHAEAALRASSGDPSRIFVFTGPDSAETYEYAGRQLTSWSALLRHGTLDWEAISDPDTAHKSVAMRFTTSEATGAPKIAQLSHYAAVAHIYQWCRSFKTHAFQVRCPPSVEKYESDDIKSTKQSTSSLCTRLNLMHLCPQLLS